MKPTAKTPKYVRNLLASGENHDFKLLTIMQDVTIVEDVLVGIYFKALLAAHTPSGEPMTKLTGVGLSPQAAVTNALTRYGVTFR